MSYEWARVDTAEIVHGDAVTLANMYGNGEVGPGDERRVAVAFSTGSDGVVLYGEPSQFLALAQDLMERFA